MEQLLIRKSTVAMHIHTLKYGMFASKGHTVSIPNEMKIAKELPLLPEEVGVIIIRKPGNNNLSKAYLVKRKNVEDALKALSVLDGYNYHVNSSKARKGYSGTAILSKEKPLKVIFDIGIEEHDQEGRVITAEYDSYFLVTVYTPNSGEGLKRLDYRTKWDIAFKKYILSLEKIKPVVICGDLNVANKEIDIARPKPNYNVSSGYTQKEVSKLLNKSEKATESLIIRARKKLKSNLPQNLDKEFLYV